MKNKLNQNIIFIVKYDDKVKSSMGQFHSKEMLYLIQSIEDKLASKIFSNIVDESHSHRFAQWESVYQLDNQNQLRFTFYCEIESDLGEEDLVEIRNELKSRARLISLDEFDIDEKHYRFVDVIVA